jgi:SPP1 gp7 family putative phage head morphogenesis protein
MPSDIAYINVSTAHAEQMINNIWCADGKTWSQRIWKNTERLTQTLNENLLHCVVAGKKTTELKRLLQERFSVSYRQADMLVRTEIAHIQTQAAAERYKDYGLQKYKFLGREEHDGCGHSPDCHDLNGKEFFFAEMKEGLNAPPMHPRCRCCIVPVVTENDALAIERARTMQAQMIKNNESAYAQRRAGR